MTTLTEYCQTPRSMPECLREGFTRDQVYNHVKHKRLVNLSRLDAWGRVQRCAGRFVAADKAVDFASGADDVAPSGFDASALVSAWGNV
jgi:hypothetical protein